MKIGLKIMRDIKKIRVVPLHEREMCKTALKIDKNSNLFKSSLFNFATDKLEKVYT